MHSNAHMVSLILSPARAYKDIYKYARSFNHLVLLILFYVFTRTVFILSQDAAYFIRKKMCTKAIPRRAILTLKKPRNPMQILAKQNHFKYTMPNGITLI